MLNLRQEDGSIFLVRMVFSACDRFAADIPQGRFKEIRAGQPIHVLRTDENQTRHIDLPKPTRDRLRLEEHRADLAVARRRHRDMTSLVMGEVALGIPPSGQALKRICSNHRRRGSLQAVHSPRLGKPSARVKTLWIHSAGGFGRGAHENERVHPLGMGQRETQCDESAHGVAEQIDAIDLKRVEKRSEVRDKLFEAPPVLPLGILGISVAAQIRRDHTTLRTKHIHLADKIVAVAREAMQHHERKAGLAGGVDRRASHFMKSKAPF